MIDFFPSLQLSPCFVFKLSSVRRESLDAQIIEEQVRLAVFTQVYFIYGITQCLHYYFISSGKSLPIKQIDHEMS